MEEGVAGGLCFCARKLSTGAQDLSTRASILARTSLRWWDPDSLLRLTYAQPDIPVPVEVEGWGRGADMVAFKNQCEGRRHLQEAAGDLKKGNKI